MIEGRDYAGPGSKGESRVRVRPTREYVTLETGRQTTRRLAAFHEAGHAVAAFYEPLAGTTTRVTIRAEDLGASDAGAHLDMIDTFAFSTVLLGNARERELVPVEEAIRQLTDVPARLYGLEGRGRLEEGACGDVVVFDADRVASGPVHVRHDLPGGAGRLYAEALGIDHVVVNGTEIVREGKHTGALPGTILHSGRDTKSVEVPGGKRA